MYNSMLRDSHDKLSVERTSPIKQNETGTSAAYEIFMQDLQEKE